MVIRVKLLFFAKARELAQVKSTEFEVQQNIIACGDLLELICDKYNLSLIRKNIILAINEEYCENPGQSIKLTNGDEIAVIPPLSGG